MDIETNKSNILWAIQKGLIRVFDTENDILWLGYFEGSRSFKDVNPIAFGKITRHITPENEFIYSMTLFGLGEVYELNFSEFWKVEAKRTFVGMDDDIPTEDFEKKENEND
jgi:hypothetical protein